MIAVPPESLIFANAGKKLKLTDADTPGDIAITIHIQQVILAADGLSAGARQVEVTTQSGRVTLRGTVASKEEKKKVGDLAATVVAANHVDNQIEVREIADSAGMGGS